jgi:cytochrome oxidase Cu insertion factor (SCO1/SenC/PrrC family)
MPAFALTDQLDRPVTSEGLQGKVLVANFVFTNCTQFCPPFLSPRMQELQQHLAQEGLLGEQVLLLSFSVDPERDTPETLRAYAELYKANPEVWRFLTGPVEEMRRVIVDGFKLPVETIDQTFEHTHPDGSVHLHQYDVAHTNRAALIDREGVVRAYYDMVLDWDIKRMLQSIRTLAEER